MGKRSIFSWEESVMTGYLMNVLKTLQIESKKLFAILHFSIFLYYVPGLKRMVAVKHFFVFLSSFGECS